MAAETKETKPEATVTKDELKTAVDKALEEGMNVGLAQGRKEGAAEASKLERERILGIEKIALPGHEALVAEMKADGKTSPGEAAIRINETEKLTREKRLEAIKKDGLAPAPSAVPSATGDTKPVADQSQPLEVRAKLEWEANAAVRKEFQGEFDRYLWARKALEGSDDQPARARILHAVN